MIKNGQLDRRTEYGTGGRHEMKSRKQFQSSKTSADRSRVSRNSRDPRDGGTSKDGDRESPKRGSPHGQEKCDPPPRIDPRDTNRNREELVEKKST